MAVDRALRIFTALRSEERLRSRELANLCGVSERTIYREACAMMQAGLPIASKRGRNGYYSLAAEFVEQSRQMSDSDFNARVQVMLGISPELPVARMMETPPTHKGERGHGLIRSILVDLNPYNDGSIVGLIDRLEDAIFQRQLVSVTVGEKTRRLVPWGVVLREPKLWLVGIEGATEVAIELACISAMDADGDWPQLLSITDTSIWTCVAAALGHELTSSVVELRLDRNAVAFLSGRRPAWDAQLLEMRLDATGARTGKLFVECLEEFAALIRERRHQMEVLAPARLAHLLS